MLRRKLTEMAAGAVLYGGMLLVCVLFAAILGVVLRCGIPHLSWKLVAGVESVLRGTAGILPAILNTLLVIVISLSVALPLGVGTAVYLNEYARSRLLVSAVTFAVEVLGGIPSILYAMVGVILFCTGLGLRKTLLSASLTLSVMILPTVIRTVQESLKAVPESFREGALGLGAGKWRTVAAVVLPSSVGGILTGCILSVGRVVGETAVLVYTAGLSTSMQSYAPENLARASGATLSSALYIYARERADPDTAFAIAVLLLALTAILNAAAALAGRRH